MSILVMNMFVYLLLFKNIIIPNLSIIGSWELSCYLFRDLWKKVIDILLGEVFWVIAILPFRPESVKTKLFAALSSLKNGWYTLLSSVWFHIPLIRSHCSFVPIWGKSAWSLQETSYSFRFFLSLTKSQGLSTIVFTFGFWFPHSLVNKHIWWKVDGNY